MNKLKNYRKEVERLDRKIISLLAHRKRVSKQIEIYKRKKQEAGIIIEEPVVGKRKKQSKNKSMSTLPPIDNDILSLAKEKRLNKLKNIGKNKNLSPKYIQQVWTEIEKI